MAGKFRLKAQMTDGIDVTSPIAQAAEIGTMIKATSFIVDIIANTATFNVAQDGEDSATYVVKAGQVVSYSAGAVSVQDRDDFYELFEEQRS